MDLLKDTVVAQSLIPTVDMTITLNGHVLGYTDRRGIMVTAENPVNLVINGQKRGSTIENHGRLTNDIIRAVQIMEGNHVTIKGGTYIGIGDYPKGYGILPQGILNKGTLSISNAHVIGTHSGIQNGGTLYVNGGTYEGYGHGGIYFAVSDTVSKVKNATLTECDIPEGYTKTAGKNGAAFYIGGGSNMRVYMDNCYIDGSVRSLVLRGTSKEQNNSLYVSNCRINPDIPIRIDNDTHKLYIGRGCNFTAEDTTRLAAVVKTNQVYNWHYK